jgi:hypothetical protein
MTQCLQNLVLPDLSRTFHTVLYIENVLEASSVGWEG